MDLLVLYRKLHTHFGPQNWWPAETPFETAVGAILTQNTAWTNVEKAIANLKQAKALECSSMLKLPTNELENLIRPSGFFRQKTERLQLFCRHLAEHHEERLENLLNQDMDTARTELLALKGIGPETADSILLYAGGHASFVVDAYTRRLLERLGRLPGSGSYDDMRDLFMASLPPDATLYNEYHALIVLQCKEICRKRLPRCSDCPLVNSCPSARY